MSLSGWIWRKKSIKAGGRWGGGLDALLLETYRQNQEALTGARFFSNVLGGKRRGFSVLEKVFGHPMPPYYVLLTHFIAGTSDWYGTDICVNAYGPKCSRENAHLYGLLYEIILSQIFMRVRQRHSAETLDDWGVWEIAEVGAFTLLHQEFDLFGAFEKTYYDAVDAKRERAQKLYQSTKNLDCFFRAFNCR